MSLHFYAANIISVAWPSDSVFYNLYIGAIIDSTDGVRFIYTIEK